MSKYNIPTYLQLPLEDITVLLVGAGGTGSEMLQRLGRINHTLTTVYNKMLTVIVVDNDVVTASNVGRQLLSKADIGRYKADVLIERTNRFYGTGWLSYTEKLAPDSFGSRLPNIIISCVDNIEARRVIAKRLSYSQIGMPKEYKNYIWIDTGNDFNTGNVIISACNDEGERVTPSMFQIFKKIKDNKAVPSCSLAEAIRSQHMFINTFVADVAASMLWDILTKSYIDYSGAFINLENYRISKIPVTYYHDKLNNCYHSGRKKAASGGRKKNGRGVAREGAQH